MDRHQGPSSRTPIPAELAPSTPRNEPSLLASVALVAVPFAFLFAGCSSPEQATAEPDATSEAATTSTVGAEDLAFSGADTPSDEQAPSDGRLSFGDPEDQGFAPVIDNDVEADVPDAAEQPELAAPADVIPEIADQLNDGPTTDELLDSIDIIDNATDVADDPDGRSRNASGEPVTLDDEANLACAHAEIAVGLLDAGQLSVALERVATAAEHAEASGGSAVTRWAEPLRSVIVDGQIADLAPLVGFLSACTEGGYEL